MEAESLKNGGDLEIEDFDDVADNDPGKYRIDNVIKSMVARLELHNTLAPIQEYGRHQVRATQKKKAKERATTNEDSNIQQEAKEANFNDQYYDLDDDFIDDDEIVIQQQEIGVDLPINETLIYSDNQTLGEGKNDLSASSRTKKMLR